MLRRSNVNTITILVLVVLAVSSFYTFIPWWAFGSILFFWFLLTVCGSFFVQWNYHLIALHQNKNRSKDHVSITFDDGPHPEFTPKVLALLKQYDVKATFFCIGKKAEQHPELLKRIVADGHRIGNHTYSHSNFFGFFSTRKVISELKSTIEIIKTITGITTKLYRPAFGVTNPMIARAVNALPIVAIGWNVRSLDTTSRSEKAILKRITHKLTKGDIILLHDTSQKTITVLEQLLLFLQEKKLTGVTVDELLEIEAYEE